MKLEHDRACAWWAGEPCDCLPWVERRTGKRRRRTFVSADELVAVTQSDHGLRRQGDHVSPSETQDRRRRK